MNGAESLVETLAASGIEVCFANPGTSEMHFVAALDKSPIRPVLCSVRRCGDRRGRWLWPHDGQAGRDAAASGPGFANGIANLHNARRAATPIVNIVGDHASWHNRYDAPLTSDIWASAVRCPHWLHSTANARTAAADAARAVAAPRVPSGPDRHFDPAGRFRPGTKRKVRHRWFPRRKPRLFPMPRSIAWRARSSTARRQCCCCAGPSCCATACKRRGALWPKAARAWRMTILPPASVAARACRRSSASPISPKTLLRASRAWNN